MVFFRYPICHRQPGQNAGVYRTAEAFLAAYLTYQADPSQPLGSGRTLKERIAAAATIE